MQQPPGSMPKQHNSIKLLSDDHLRNPTDNKRLASANDSSGKSVWMCVKFVDCEATVHSNTACEMSALAYHKNQDTCFRSFQSLMGTQSDPI